MVPVGKVGTIIKGIHS